MGITNFDIVQANQFLGGFHAALWTQGSVYYVNPRLGNDSYSGLSPIVDGRPGGPGPLATLTAAYGKCTAGQNDTVVLISAGNSASDTTSRLSATLTWAKNNTHLIGLGANPMVSQRTRIAPLSTATAADLTSMLNITASSCRFQNIQVYHGLDGSGATGPAVIVSGERNVFENVHFAGMGHSTMVGAGGASLKLNGGSENTFARCVFGLDTVSAANLSNGELWFDADASRNHFEDCLFQRYISNAGYVHVTVEDATGIDRWQIFKNCLFIADSVNRGVEQTAIMSIPAMTQGRIFLTDTYYSGEAGEATVWEANARGVVQNNAVAAAAAAVGGQLTLLD